MSSAKTVRFQNGVPVPTDGPYAEVKESLPGYWIVDVSEDHALEIGPASSRASSTPSRCGSMGDTVAARESYLRAAKMTASVPEQRYLALRAARLHEPPFAL